MTILLEKGPDCFVVEVVVGAVVVAKTKAFVFVFLHDSERHIQLYVEVYETHLKPMEQGLDAQWSTAFVFDS